MKKQLERADVLRLLIPSNDTPGASGTLDLHGVNKGIFITTSKFPKDTIEILKKTPKNLILIDGTKLATLMIEHDVGVTTEKTYQVKKINLDFFQEE